MWNSWSSGNLVNIFCFVFFGCAFTARIFKLNKVPQKQKDQEEQGNHDVTKVAVTKFLEETLTTVLCVCSSVTMEPMKHARFNCDRLYEQQHLQHDTKNH